MSARVVLLLLLLSSRVVMRGDAYAGAGNGLGQELWKLEVCPVGATATLCVLIG